MSPHQPALNERRNTVYARQNLISVLAGAFDGLSLMDVIVFYSAGIGFLDPFLTFQTIVSLGEF
jgi:hypothetical protein